MAGADDEEEDLPATQPVLNLVLNGVVAYVEVRSGHDNRSRGVKTQLRSLGAKVVDGLTTEVTHVVFNEGLPSTYKKAKKLKCHLVSVLWIEACKEAQDLVPEAGYPPIGQHIYEDPFALKNFKKMKSMQPDFEEEVAEKKIGKILRSIKRRTTTSGTKATKKATYNKCNQASAIKKARKPPKAAEVSRKKYDRLAKVSDPHLPSSSRQAAHENVGPKENFSKQYDPDLIVSELSNHSSVIFCGIEKPALPKSSRNLHDNSLQSIIAKKAHPNDPPMSRNEFVNHLSDLVHMLRNDNENAENVCCKSSQSPESLFQKKTPYSSPLKSPGISPSVELDQKKVRFHLPNDNAKKTDCVSASAFLLRRKASVQPSQEDSVLLSQEAGDMPFPDTFPILGRKVKGFVNAGGEQISFSQIVASYDAFAKDYVKRQFNSCAGEMVSTSNTVGADPLVPGGDLYSSGTSSQTSAHKEDITSKLNEECKLLPTSEETNFSESGSSASCSSTTVIINGIPVCNEFNSGSFDRHMDVSVERDSSNLSESSTKENIPSNAPLAPEEVESLERGPSPVFVIRKPKFRRQFKSTYSCSSRSELKSSSSFKCNSNLEQLQSTNSLQVNPSNGQLLHRSKSPNEKVEEENGGDPVQYLNATVNYLKHKFLPHLIGTPASQKRDNFTVLAEDTPEIFSNAEVPSTSHSSVYIPPTPPLFKNLHHFKTQRDSRNNPLPFPLPLSEKKFGNISDFNQQAQQTRDEVDVASHRLPSQPCSDSCIHLEGTDGILTEAREEEKNSSKQDKPACAEFIPESQSPSHNTSSNNNDSEVQHNNSNSDLKELALNSSQSCQNISENGSTSIRRSQRHVKLTSVTSAVNKPAHEVSQDSTADGISRSRKRLRKSSIEKQSFSLRSNLKKRKSAHSNECKDTLNLSFPLLVSDVKERQSRSRRNTTVSLKSSTSSDNQSPKKLNTNAQSVNASSSPAPAKKRSDVYEDSSSNENSEERMVSSRSLKRGRTREKGPSHHEPSSAFLSRSLSLSLDGSRKSSQDARKRLAKSLTRVSPRPKNSKVIVCTFLTASEQHAIESSLQALHGWSIEAKVTSRTTHIVSSGPKRTINMLKGMGRGCWLVRQDWVHESSKNGDWLSEEKFELVEFSPAVKSGRLKRQSLGDAFQRTLFSTIGPIFVSPKMTAPPAKDVRELVQLWGGEITSARSKAHLVIGIHDETVHSLHASWILDSITKNKVLPISKQYEILAS